MTGPIRFTYAGKPWIMTLKPRQRPDGTVRLVRSFKPDGHHPPVAQFIGAARAFNKRLDARAGHS